jgi:perosamine synthetase
VGTISFFDTHVGPDALERVRTVLESGRLSEGALATEFERRLSGDLGLVNPVTVNSGTSALHLALAALGIGPGDEVILPAQTFVASGLVVLHQGATPVFADIDYRTGNLDPDSVEAHFTPRTRAIMVVHWGGLPADLDALSAIARDRGVPVIEDAAHALGATYHDAPIGSISEASCFSFQAIKHLTTGDGGAICTPSGDLAAEARRRRWFGIDRLGTETSHLGEREYDLSSIGFKYHLNDYAAALGIANLAGFHERLRRRRSIAARYRSALDGVSGVTLFDEPADRLSAYWLFGIHVERRDDFVRALSDAGVPASVVHLGIDRNSILGGTRADLPNQRRFDQTQIHIPIHDRIGEEEADIVISAIRNGW